MWRRPRLVTADTKSPAPQPGGNAWWRGAFAPDPATGTEAGPGPTTPRRSAVRRASRLRGRAHASQAWRRALLRDMVQGWTSLGAPPIPSLGGRQRRRREEEGRKPGGKNAPGMKKAALFDIVNRKRRGWRIGNVVLDGIASAATRSCPGRARASACLFARGASSRARAGTQGHTTCCLWVPGLAALARDTRAEPGRG